MRTTTFCTSVELSFLSLSACIVLLTWTTVGGSFAGPLSAPGFFLTGFSLSLYLSRSTSFKRRVTVFSPIQLFKQLLFIYLLFIYFITINFSLLFIYSFPNYYLISHIYLSLYLFDHTIIYSLHLFINDSIIYPSIVYLPYFINLFIIYPIYLLIFIHL